VEDIDGLMNLIATCIIVILGNVLDSRTYVAPSQHFTQLRTPAQEFLMSNHDVNAITTNERMAICYARGAALHLFAWIRECCIILGPDGSIVDDLPSYFFVQIGRAMLSYKESCEAKDLAGVPHCSLSLLTAQINNVVDSHDRLYDMWTSHPNLLSESLVLENIAKYEVKWKAGWQDSEEWKSSAVGKFDIISVLKQLIQLISFFFQLEDYKSYGCTAFDINFFETQSNRAQAEQANIEALLKSRQPAKKRRKIISKVR
jgi:hypothetical protein